MRQFDFEEEQHILLKRFIKNIGITSRACDMILLLPEPLLTNYQRDLLVFTAILQEMFKISIFALSLKIDNLRWQPNLPWASNLIYYLG